MIGVLGEPGARGRRTGWLVATLLAGLFLAGAAIASEDTCILEAQKLFKQYTDLERAYDPSQSDLFSSTAAIRDTRVYQDGTNKLFTWSGENYKLIIKAQMPVSRARGEQYVYSQVTYAREGNNVRIKCNRYSPQKKAGAPLEMLVAPNGKNGFKIVEEICQSQP
jgi:hypothetical protein